MSRPIQGALAVAALLVLVAVAYLAATSHSSEAAGPLAATPGDVRETEPDAGTTTASTEETTEGNRPEAAPALEVPPVDVPPLEVFAADTATTAMLAGDAPPETVLILAEQRSGRDLYVLAAVDHTGDVTAGPALDGTTGIDEEEDEEEEEEEEEAVDPCEELDGQDDAYCDCIVRSAPSPDLGYHTVLGTTVTRIELFRVHEDRAGRTVQAHRTLTAPVLYETDPASVPELRVNDVDHDGRPEVTAIFSFAVPDCDTFQEDWGTLGVILEGSDLHVQAAFAREHVSSGGDSDVNTVSEETVWRFAPSAADAAAEPIDTVPLDTVPPDTVQLEVRRTERSSFMEAEDEAPSRDHGASRWICPYDAAADRWTCPNDATVLTTWVSTVLLSLETSGR